MSGIKNIYIMASRMLAQRGELEVIANNVANANTGGYKKVEMDFASLIPRKNGEDVGVFAKRLPLRLDTTSGGLSPTGNPLDAAIEGTGFFAVSVDGQTHYTRHGHFRLDVEGNLVNANGYPVLDTNNAPITIPQDAGNIVITGEGTIAGKNGPIADLGVFDVPTEGMVNTGAGLYMPAGQEDIPIVERPTVVQAMLEESNVNPIAETVRMTELLRTYQNAANLMRSVEDLEGRAVRDLARLPN